jgi:hypothetical protein
MLTYFPIYLVNSGYAGFDMGGLNLVGASLPSFAVSAAVYVVASRLLAPSSERSPA